MDKGTPGRQPKQQSATESRFALQAADPSNHAAVIHSDTPFHFELRTDLAAIGQIIRELVKSGAWGGMTSGEMRVFIAILTLANGKRFRATGEIICWPKLETIIDLAGRGRTVVFEAMASLAARGLLEYTDVRTDHGATVPGFRIPLPQGDWTRPPGKPRTTANPEYRISKSSKNQEAEIRKAGLRRPGTRPRKSGFPDDSLFASLCNETVKIENKKKQTAADAAAVLAFPEKSSDAGPSLNRPKKPLGGDRVERERQELVALAPDRLGAACRAARASAPARMANAWRALDPLTTSNDAFRQAVLRSSRALADTPICPAAQAHSP